MFHPEHFTSTTCNMELIRKNFFERDGKPYCELDYHTLFSPRCAACEGPILDKCVSALDRAWHPEHFVCEDCERPFGDDGYHEQASVPTLNILEERRANYGTTVYKVSFPTKKRETTMASSAWIGEGK